MSPSPYAQAFRELLALGYHPIPIIPPPSEHPGRGKAPGEFKNNSWRGMSDWQRFRDRRPTDFETAIWSTRWPDANIGIVLGTPIGRDYLIAVDIDTQDADAFDDIISQLPHTPMRKRGAKGETRFYRAPGSIKTKSYDDTRDGRRDRIIDLLTGFETRQTVCPPSLHKEGMTYAWLEGPVAAHDLPLFDDDALTKLEETLEMHGYDPNHKAAQAQAKRAVSQNSEPYEAQDDYWSEVKTAALAHLDAWVPKLGLYGLTKNGRGYRSVASFRGSLSNKPMEQRNLHLAIHPEGIKDWGTDQGYSAIDLVMTVLGYSQPEATDWLRDQLGLVTGPAIELQSKAPTDAALQIPRAAAPPAQELKEFPEHLTRVPGILGDVLDWICDTSRRPQRGLSLGAALTLLGTAAGQKYAGPTRTATHLYVLGLARTAAGKDHALQQIARVLTESGLDKHIGPSSFMSQQAVVKRLTRAPISLCAMDEFGSFIARVNSARGNAHERAITGILRTAWGASFQTVAPPEWAGQDADPIRSPALSIYGVSTPEEFYSALEGGDVHNGFLNRFLLFSTKLRPRERDPAKDPFFVPARIIDGMKAIYERNPMASATTTTPHVMVPWADEAAKKVYKDLGLYVENDRERDAAFMARTVEMAQRLATIRAIGCDPFQPEISVADMEWGRDVALWSADRMIAETSDYLAETEHQANAQKVLRTVKEHGPSLPHQRLVHLMRHTMKARELAEVLESLKDAGQLDEAFGDVPAGGGKRPRFYTVIA